jgi:hypothetical protein
MACAANTRETCGDMTPGDQTIQQDARVTAEGAAKLAIAAPPLGQTSPRPAPNGAAELDGGTIDVPPEVPQMLEDARSLLVYLVGKGERPREELTTALFQGERAIKDKSWTVALGNRFLTASAELSKIARPVTAQSLADSQGAVALANLKRWRRYVEVLLPVILVLSAATYANDRFARELKELIDGTDKMERPDFIPSSTPSNGSAGDSKGAPAGTSPATDGKLAERQLFAMSAATERMYLDTRILHWLTLGVTQSGEEPTSDLKLDETIQELRVMRVLATFVLNTDATVYGMLNTYFLTLMCALLGACAFGLRSLSEQTMAMTFIASYAGHARVSLAIIAGFAVSLFSPFTEKLSLQPLATAFIAGYAVETFFTFLDSLLQSVPKTRAP